MISGFRILPWASLLVLAGCIKPYIQDPATLGEKPATLILDTKFMNKEYGLMQVNLAQSVKTCNGAGKAKVDIKQIGAIYNDSMNILQEKVLVPVDKGLIVEANYHNVTFFSTQTCEIAIEFQPESGKEYFYTTGREREAGFIKGAGNCRATILERIPGANGEVKLAEVRPLFFGSMGGMGTFFCDDKGNILTDKAWKKFQDARNKSKKEEQSQSKP